MLDGSFPYTHFFGGLCSHRISTWGPFLTVLLRPVVLVRYWLAFLNQDLTLTKLTEDASEIVDIFFTKTLPRNFKQKLYSTET